ncbi:lytic transglycosylase domain-containing protein [Aureimonas fodinaquatilis]|uniref:Lytic transglycosylase domain-containing protein n=1 Tax=Aureimonas fodinaquatilis TaxID=2565783 RepID=A0A5B0DXF6_9HYPH|nr:lytic transglycosylase domain-containing protein [Aureimonas fodinaquatilis]KAA0971038.1 lytic transglycosylase domain-containing protein [Aureimonas fodinaquatilis]
MSLKSCVRSLVVQTALASIYVAGAAAQTALPTAGPMPTLRSGAPVPPAPIDNSRFGAPAPVPSPAPALAPRPAAPAAAAAPAANAFTSSIAAPARSASVRPVRGSLKDGLDATHNDMRTARAIRAGMAPDSLDHQILTWAIALRGGSDVPASEIGAAMRELQGWPGMQTLRENSERALYREDRPATDILNTFASSAPQTPQGNMALARALIQTGQAGKAKSIIVSVWRNERLDQSLETQILNNFGTLLTKADHKYRMDMLLYAGRVSDAQRVAGLANSETLYRARAASIRGAADADQLLARVPANQRSDPSFLFTQAENLRKKNQPVEAAKILMSAPRDPALLVDGDKWWNEQRIVSRMLLERGQAAEAYRLVSRHSASGIVSRVEAEFHAGWYAMRALGDPRTAGAHFAKIAQVSNRPLTQSRAYYWMGRAAEVGGPGNANRYFAQAAQYGATFYGQLAAVRLRQTPGDIRYPSPSNSDRQRFQNRNAVKAILRLQEIGSDWRAAQLYRSLSEELESPGELALLAGLAERRGNHALSLDVGKRAYARGVNAPALAFPTGVIPDSARISPSGKALAYAIARQESAFNPRAKSPVGALGLLQLMPATAQSLSKEAGLPYSEAKLLSDVSYNAQLGSQYLGNQISSFDGSYVLTFAAYNAGPRRAREWIQRFGDPRGQPLDEVVDWIEMIPFTETRNYVQRVMENYQVYKIRLGAGFSIEKDLRTGRN